MKLITILLMELIMKETKTTEDERRMPLSSGKLMVRPIILNGRP